MKKLLKCLCAAMFVVGLSLSGVGCAEKTDGPCNPECKKTCEKKCEPKGAAPCQKKAETPPAAPAQPAAKPAPQGEKK